MSSYLKEQHMVIGEENECYPVCVNDGKGPRGMLRAVQFVGF